MRLKRSGSHSNSQFKLGHSVAGQRRSKWNWDNAGFKLGVEQYPGQSRHPAARPRLPFLADPKRTFISARAAGIVLALEDERA